MTAKEQAELEGVTPQAIYMRRWRARNPRYTAEYMPAWRRRRREMALSHYGGKCACCGEDRYEFLSFDHINGGGTRERMASPDKGAGIVSRLIREGFPDGFRVLCRNCNQAIGFYGACPHEVETSEPLSLEESMVG